MRIARLSPVGFVEEIVLEDLCPTSAETRAQEAALRQPGIFFAVVPDDSEEVMSIAHRSKRPTRARVAVLASRR